MSQHSRYQLAVFDATQNTNRNLAVRAVAGSGKSYTLEHAVQVIPPELTVLCVAFNRDIVKALKPRIKHPKAEVMTINAFGYRICRKGIRGMADVDAFKTENIAKGFFGPDEQGFYYKFKNSISRLVELFRANLIYPNAVNPDKIREIADEYGIELPSEKPAYFDLVGEVYTRCVETYAYPDWRDQVFMPLYLDLEIPIYDVVLIDESQDLDRNQIELMVRAGRRIIMAGDPNQAIYGFRGAMTNAMEEMVSQIDAVELPLSICYRCPKSVVRAAQEEVPEMEPWDQAPEGKIATIKMDEFHKLAQSGDYVLCRCTAPLVSECLRMIRDGKKATVKGREIGTQLTVLIDKLAGSDAEPIEQFYRALGRYHMDQLAAYTRSEREDLILQLNDRVDTLRVLAEATATVADLKARITTIFTDTVAGVVFMTVHKSKGLENPRVFILAPELLPHPAAKKPWQKKQERNLRYVAKTRVQFTKTSDGELYWVETPSKDAPRVEAKKEIIDARPTEITTT